MRAAVDALVLALGDSLAASILFKMTLTTALALVGTWLARRNRAAVRHVLLASAFVVMALVPIATLVAPAIHIAVPITRQNVTKPLSVESFTNIAPTTIPVSSGSVARTPRSSLPSPTALLFITWITGTMLFLLPVIAGLWQTRSMRRFGLPWKHGQSVADRLALDSGIRRRVDVLLHEAVTGPMICGVVHPAVILPLDAQAWPDDELSRAIVHELEHVRRGDWISRCLARAVCAVYWFHPLVWVAWQQFVLEAERACDDAVLQRAEAMEEATEYADQLVMLAKRLMTAQNPPLLAMANRHDLAKRVAALLDRRQPRGRAGALWVGLACTVSVLLITTISPLRIVARTQNPATQIHSAAGDPKFEVASVKPCKEEDYAIPGQRRPEFTASPGRITINCLPLQRIIFFAYAGIGSLDHPLLNDSPSNPDHIRGGPRWIQSDTFVIEAKAAGTPDRTVMMGPMLRALLEERFHLTNHRETETVPMYALTVAKGGLKIQPLVDGGCTSQEAAQALSQDARMALIQGGKPVCGGFTSLGDGVNGNWILGGTSLGKFAQTLSGVLDRYVMDSTGVAGLFNINLRFGFDDNITPGVFGGRPSRAYSVENPPPTDVERAPSIFTAVEEQLGLRIEKANGPHEFLVIDSVEKPAGM